MQHKFKAFTNNSIFQGVFFFQNEKRNKGNMKICTSAHEEKLEKKRMLIKFPRNIEEMLVDSEK